MIFPGALFCKNSLRAMANDMEEKEVTMPPATSALEVANAVLPVIAKETLSTSSTMPSVDRYKACIGCGY